MNNTLKKLGFDFKTHPIKDILAYGLSILIVIDFIFIIKILTHDDFMFGYLLVYGFFFIQIPAILYFIFFGINKFRHRTDNRPPIRRELILFISTIILDFTCKFLRDFLH